MKEGLFMNDYRRTYSHAASIVTLVLGLVTLAVAAVALIYHYVDQRSFYKKWDAFQDNGFLD